MIELVPAEDWHASVIAAMARDADRAELWAAGRHAPLDAMRAGMKVSRSSTAMLGSEPVAMFGVTPVSLLLGRGIPWMVGSRRLDEMALKRALLREAVSVVRGWQARYDFLLNFVDDRNTSAIRWLRWLGFTVSSETQPIGEDGMPFRTFHWRRDV